MYRVEDRIVILKRLIADTVSNWNSRLSEAAKRKDDKTLTPASARKPQLLNLRPETDGYITDDAVPESHTSDENAVSADYHAIEAIAVTNQSQIRQDSVTSEQVVSDIPVSVPTTNPEDIVVVQGKQII